MKYNFKFMWRNRHGEYYHKKPFKSIENAKAAIAELEKRCFAAGRPVRAWAIQNTETGELVEELNW